MEGLAISIEGLLVVCVLTEAFVQIVKASTGGLSEIGCNITAMAIAVLLCFALKVSIFVGDTWLVYIGSVLAGLIASRGSNFVHDVYDAVTNISK